MKTGNFFKELISWACYIIVAAVLAISLNVFIFQITTVSGISMMQTLQDGDIYLTSKLGHTFKQYPKHGEIVVIDSRVHEPRTFATELRDIYHHNIITTLVTGSQPKDFWVKRIIGLPGDEIRTVDGKVYRNGAMLDETYINPLETPVYEDKTYTVPEGCVFVMGDNRNHSNDSRVIGPVPLEHVLGSVKIKFKSGN